MPFGPDLNTELLEARDDRVEVLRRSFFGGAARRALERAVRSSFLRRAHDRGRFESRATFRPKIREVSTNDLSNARGREGASSARGGRTANSSIATRVRRSTARARRRNARGTRPPHCLNVAFLSWIRARNASRDHGDSGRTRGASPTQRAEAHEDRTGSHLTGGRPKQTSARWSGSPRNRTREAKLLHRRQRGAAERRGDARVPPRTSASEKIASRRARSRARVRARLIRARFCPRRRGSRRAGAVVRHDARGVLPARLRVSTPPRAVPVRLAPRSAPEHEAPPSRRSTAFQQVPGTRTRAATGSPATAQTRAPGSRDSVVSSSPPLSRRRHVASGRAAKAPRHPRRTRARLSPRASGETRFPSGKNAEGVRPHRRGAAPTDARRRRRAPGRTDSREFFHKIFSRARAVFPATISRWCAILPRAPTPHALGTSANATASFLAPRPDARVRGGGDRSILEPALVAPAPSRTPSRVRCPPADTARPADRGHASRLRDGVVLVTRTRMRSSRWRPTRDQDRGDGERDAHGGADVSPLRWRSTPNQERSQLCKELMDDVRDPSASTRVRGGTRR